MNTNKKSPRKNQNIRVLVSIALLVVIAFILPLFVKPYMRTLIQRGLIWILAVLGVYLLYSHLRQVHFAQSIFIGVGGYITAFLAGKYFVTNELLVLLPLGLVAGAIVAGIVGIFLMKRSGFYFAMMGISVTMLFWSIIYKTRTITGGSDGIASIKNPSIFLIKLNDQALYYVIVLLTVGLILLMWRILHSPFSLQLRAIGGDIEKAESVGMPVKSMQRIAFIISGAYAGVAGVLLAFSYNYVSPNFFSWEFGGNFVNATIIGGVTYFMGPLLGTFAFIFLELEVSTAFPNLWEIVEGIIVILLVTTVGDQGVYGVLKISYDRLRALLRLPS